MAFNNKIIYIPNLGIYISWRRLGNGVVDARWHQVRSDAERWLRNPIEGPNAPKRVNG